MKLGDPLSAAALSIVEKYVGEYYRWSFARLIEEQKSFTIKSTLYHFTGYEGLRGILENSNMRLTHHAYQNDPTEFIHGIKIAIACMKAVARNNGIEVYEDLRDCIQDLLGNPENLNFLSAYFACFTTNVRDIGHWRTYGRDGQGCAIGFSKKMFTVDSDEIFPEQDRVWVGKVAYPSRRCPSRFHDPMIAIAQLLLNAVEEIGVRPLADPVAQWNVVREFANSVIAQPTIWNALTTKHPGYQTEREVRLVKLGLKSEYEKIELRNERGATYVPYRFDRSKMVVKVVLGPDAPEEGIDLVNAYLSRLGMPKIPVVKSTLPYRSLEERRITVENIEHAFR